MSKVVKAHLKNACLFDNSKVCPVQPRFKGIIGEDFLKSACKICPIRIKMIPEEARLH